jgi:hypothetical protein
LTIQRGDRCFGVLAIENYSSVNSFGIPKNCYAHGFYNASTAIRRSLSIIWTLPALTIKMLKDPISGVTLDAKVIQNRGF